MTYSAFLPRPAYFQNKAHPRRSSFAALHRWPSASSAAAALRASSIHRRVPAAFQGRRVGIGSEGTTGRAEVPNRSRNARRSLPLGSREGNLALTASLSMGTFGRHRMSSVGPEYLRPSPKNWSMNSTTSFPWKPCIFDTGLDAGLEVLN
jgi:hypothetical protein